MTFPLTFSLGPLSLSAHLAFETLGFFLGYRYFSYLKQKQGDTIEESHRIWIIIAAAFGAFVFSRLIGALEDPSAWLTSDHPFLYFYSTKTIVGGLLGALLCVELTKAALGVKHSSGDLFTYPLMLAMIIGRIGCFTSGIYESTYGIPSGLPWAVNLGDGIPRHPVALYEIVFLIILWTLMRHTERKVTFNDGVRFKVFMISYLAFRLGVDMLKPGERLLPGISTIQLSCIAGLVYYHRTIFYAACKPSSLISKCTTGTTFTTTTP